MRTLLALMKPMNNPYLNQLRKKSTKEFTMLFPQLIKIQQKCIHVNNNPPFSDEPLFKETDLFNVKSYGLSWELHIGLVKKSDFSSREEFEEAIYETELREQSYHPYEEKKRLPIREALQQLNIFMRMREGLCENEEDKEDERFNLEMLNIFGEDNDSDTIDEKTGHKVCQLKDFRIINQDGNFIHATSVRDNYYLFFVSVY